MQGKVEICGVNTARLKVLSHEETTALLKRTKTGDTDAREQLISGNLRLVLSIIQRFNCRGEMMDDLFQVGCVGLIKAVDNFDLSHEVRFSTYAVPMIIGEIRRYMRDNSSVRVSRSLRDMAYKALSVKEQLTSGLQRDPTIEEIAGQLGVPKEEIVMALDAITEPVSMFEPVYSENGDAIYVMDQIRDQTSHDDNWLEEMSLKDAIRRLSNREKRILSLRFFEGKTQMEVASEIGISQEQVSRLEKNALCQIKKMI